MRRSGQSEEHRRLNESRSNQTAAESGISESIQGLHHESESGLVRVGLVQEVSMDAAYNTLRSHDQLRMH